MRKIVTLFSFPIQKKFLKVKNRARIVLSTFLPVNHLYPLRFQLLGKKYRWKDQNMYRKNVVDPR